MLTEYEFDELDTKPWPYPANDAATVHGCGGNCNQGRTPCDCAEAATEIGADDDFDGVGFFRGLLFAVLFTSAITIVSVAVAVYSHH